MLVLVAVSLVRFGDATCHTRKVRARWTDQFGFLAHQAGDPRRLTPLIDEWAGEWAASEVEESLVD